MKKSENSVWMRYFREGLILRETETAFRRHTDTMGHTVTRHTQGCERLRRINPRRCGLLLFLLLMSAPGIAATRSVGVAADNPPAAAAAPEDAGTQDPDECDRSPEDQPIQEETQDTLRSWSCHTFRWFDSWWGDKYDFEESKVNGWLMTGIEYRDYDGLDPTMRFKVRAPLPNMNRRWDVLFGRVDEEAYITDTEPRDNEFYNSGLVDRGQDESWLLGLGHRRGRGRSGWDWSVGVRLRVPPEPYVRLSWLYRKKFTADTDLFFRQTFFWRTNDGFGTTSRANVTSRLSARDVMRWESIARFTERTQGADWYVGQTWFHLLPSGTAMSLLAFVDGETQRPVEITDAGFQLIWRRPFTRDWIYLSWGPSLTWPRRQPEDERKADPGFGVWIEMEFGNWRY